MSQHGTQGGVAQPADDSGVQFDVTTAIEDARIVLSTSTPGHAGFNVENRLTTDEAHRLAALIRDGDAITVRSHLSDERANDLARTLEVTATRVKRSQ